MAVRHAAVYLIIINARQYFQGRNIASVTVTLPSRQLLIQLLILRLQAAMTTVT